MNRSTLKRLETLERQAPQDMGKTHVILVCSDDEEEQQTQALKTSPQWTDGDTLMVIRLVGLILIRQMLAYLQPLRNWARAVWG